MPNNNRCRFCGKILLGLSPCLCNGLYENQKLWDSSKRKAERKRLEKLKNVTTK